MSSDKVGPGKTMLTQDFIGWKTSQHPLRAVNDRGVTSFLGIPPLPRMLSVLVNIAVVRGWEDMRGGPLFSQTFTEYLLCTQYTHSVLYQALY